MYFPEMTDRLKWENNDFCRISIFKLIQIVGVFHSSSRHFRLIHSSCKAVATFLILVNWPGFTMSFIFPLSTLLYLKFTTTSVTSFIYLYMSKLNCTLMGLGIVSGVARNYSNRERTFLRYNIYTHTDRVGAYVLKRVWLFVLYCQFFFVQILG